MLKKKLYRCFAILVKEAKTAAVEENWHFQIVINLQGECVDVVDVGDIRTLPRELGSHEFTVSDNPVELGKTIYYIKAVDEDDNRHWISWGNRTMFTKADCLSGIAHMPVSGC